MKQFIFLLGCMLLLSASGAQTANCRAASNLIPKPVYCADKPGSFEVTAKTRIYATHEFADQAKLLAAQLHLSKAIVSQIKEASIVISHATKKDKLGKEGYLLTITPDHVLIQAITVEGAIHALLSLIQLQLLQPDMTRIPCAKIIDFPGFGYRGMHLDVSRNFFPVSFIKKYLDLMALYKYNTFHWHLTDGPGWRLEIKKYPELTEQAAFRTDRAWTDWWKTSRKYSRESDPDAYGGYYTREEAKEVVAYAAQRGITVIPEIEMPGHSEEVLAVFPQLSCSGKPYQNGVFCIGNPQTLKFLENVLTEVMDIFPSPYIHIGGDEANPEAWEHCEKCQKLMKENGLKNGHELQSYLIKQMAQFLKAHGRKLLGWDEIVEGGLPADATVMNWRGTDIGIKAIQQKHDVIMTPGTTYFDHYQSDPTTQPPAIGGFLPINQVYNFEPLPNGLTAEEQKHVLGTQANLWTEYMPTTYQVEYMAWPRALALAEVAWSQKKNRDFEDFLRRLQAHYLLLQRKNVNYYRPSTYLTVIAQPDYNKQQDEISFLSEQYQPEIRYTTDGRNPNAASDLYTKPFYTSGKTEIKAAIFKSGQQMGTTTDYTANYDKAIGKKVMYNTAWSDAYPAQKEQTLTNGICGSLTYQDKQWLGYLNDFDVTIDMDSVQPVSSVAVRFMHQPGPGVYLPSYVEILFSDDGITFTPYEKQTHDISPDNLKLAFKTFEFKCDKHKARYIRIIAPNVMKGFMFVDEIVVY